MAAFDDITKKAQEFLQSDQVKGALHSEQAEQVSDKVLDALADTVDKATGGKHHDRIEGAREQADKRIGNE